jgi:predicted dienelactone hydrolase
MKRPVALAAALGALWFAGPASAAGLSLFEAPVAEGPPIAGAIWSPCAAPAGTATFGAHTLPGVKDCPVEGQDLPLVVVSHGFGGWWGGHHDTAEALADAGFIVVAIDHPGDSSRADPARKMTLPALTDRPADIRRVLDYLLTAWPGAAKIDPERIGFFGFSRGGFTGLALIGGEIDWRKAMPILCPPDARVPACLAARAMPLPDIRLVHDPRIKAAVIADPFLGSAFTPESLGAATAKVQLWSSQQGGDGVHPDDPFAAAQNLPATREFRIVDNSAHFAFLAPCTPLQAQAAPQICADPPGFDRIAFHARFDAEVVKFLRTQLAPRP